MTTDNFCFYLQNRLIQTSQTGGHQYSDTSLLVFSDSGDSLPLGMLSVGDSITDDILKENFVDPSGFLIYEARDTLDDLNCAG